jgi:hypothetical protein
MRSKGYLLFLFPGLTSSNLISQQAADTTFNPVIMQPEYPLGKGPVVAIDEGHCNRNRGRATVG